MGGLRGGTCRHLSLLLVSLFSPQMDQEGSVLRRNDPPECDRLSGTSFDRCSAEERLLMSSLDLEMDFEEDLSQGSQGDQHQQQQQHAPPSPPFLAPLPPVSGGEEADWRRRLQDTRDGVPVAQPAGEAPHLSDETRSRSENDDTNGGDGDHSRDDRNPSAPDGEGEVDCLHLNPIATTTTTTRPSSPAASPSSHFPARYPSLPLSLPLPLLLNPFFSFVLSQPPNPAQLSSSP